MLPTEEAVAAMLKGTSHKPDETVGEMRPSSPHEAWSYTVEMVAVNAVMAGARPEFFPVILAIAETGTTALFTSTTSFARMVVVNGPIAKEIGMNSGIGAMGPFNEANAVIGRAWTLLSINLGTSGRPGVVYMGSQGNNLNYNNVCIAENEERLPEGWKPFHVQKGFKKEESVVSTFNGHYLVKSLTASPPDVKYTQHQGLSAIIRHFQSIGPSHSVKGNLLLDPIVATALHDDEGFKTKEDLIKWLIENTFQTAWEYWRIYPSDLKAAKEGKRALCIVVETSGRRFGTGTAGSSPRKSTRSRARYPRTRFR